VEQQPACVSLLLPDCQDADALGRDDPLHPPLVDMTARRSARCRGFSTQREAVDLICSDRCVSHLGPRALAGLGTLRANDLGEAP
jgi:hypothetical protein